MIAALSGTGSLSGLYPQYNSKKVKRVRALRGDERTAEEIKDNSRKASSAEDVMASKYEASLLENAKDQEYLTYSSDNPYDRLKQALDEGFLVGMNLDVLA